MRVTDITYEAGEKDPLIPAEDRDRLISQWKARQADWQFLIYGRAGHAFTDRGVDAFAIPDFKYDAATDGRSRAAMRQMFEECFGTL